MLTRLFVLRREYGIIQTFRRPGYQDSYSEEDEEEGEFG